MLRNADTLYIDRYEYLSKEIGSCREIKTQYLSVKGCLYSLTKCRKVLQTCLNVSVFLCVFVWGLLRWPDPSLDLSFFWTAQPWLCPEEPFNSAASESQHYIVGMLISTTPTASETAEIRLVWHMQGSYISRLLGNVKRKRFTLLSKLHHLAGMMRIVCEGNEERASKLKEFLS